MTQPREIQSYLLTKVFPNSLQQQTKIKRKITRWKRGRQKRKAKERGKRGRQKEEAKERGKRGRQKREAKEEGIHEKFRETIDEVSKI